MAIENMKNIFSTLVISDEEFEDFKKADNEDCEWGKMLDLQENEEKVFNLKCEDGSVATFKR